MRRKPNPGNFCGPLSQGRVEVKIVFFGPTACLCHMRTSVLSLWSVTEVASPLVFQHLPVGSLLQPQGPA